MPLSNELQYKFWADETDFQALLHNEAHLQEIPICIKARVVEYADRRPDPQLPGHTIRSEFMRGLIQWA